MTEISVPLVRAPRMRGARACFTTRHGGVGQAPFDTFNLALHVGDHEAAVRRNRENASRAVGAPVVAVDQVHSVIVHRLPEVGDPGPVTADAMVTSRTDVALMILVADCVPVLLSDSEAGVIGAAHAGRRGLLEGILPATVAAMVELGAQPRRIDAVVGPSICGSCYEVPAAMREEGERILPGLGADTSWGTPSLDLRAGSVLSLASSGIPEASIDAEHPCTLEDERFFSYRRASRTGRFAGIIRRA